MIKHSYLWNIFIIYYARRMLGTEMEGPSPEPRHGTKEIQCVWVV